MILRQRVLAPLFIASVVLGMTFPLLEAMGEASTGVFYGPGVYVITQRDADHLLDEGLVADLQRQPWAQGVSPEVYAPIVVGGQEVVVRGIEPEGFAAVEGLQVLEGSIPPNHFALAGRLLAQRLHLRVAQALVLTGALEPGIAQVRLTAIVATGGPSEDELLVPRRLGSWLATVGSEGIPVVRVRTSDPQALREFVRGEGQGVGSAAGDGAGQGDDRIANLLLLDPRLGRYFGRHYVATVAQYGLNSVQVALRGFTFLTLALFILGSGAALGKELEEGRGRLGILRVLGATRGQLALRVLREALPLATPAGMGGVAAGLLIASAAGALRPFLLFGHTVVIAVDPLGAMALGAGAVGLVALTSVVLALHLSRRPPVVLLGRQGGEGPIEGGNA